MEAAPPTPFKMAEPKLLLKLLIVALDAPAQFGDVDQPAERDVFRKGREPVFGRLVLALGPLDQQPLFRSALGELVITMRDPTRTRANREDSHSAVPSRHLIVRHARLGSSRASCLTEIG
jgi:hypothetical protein